MNTFKILSLLIMLSLSVKSTGAQNANNQSDYPGISERLTKVYNTVTVGFTVTNMVFAITNIEKLSNPNSKNSKAGATLFLISGIAQSIIGIGLLNERDPSNGKLNLAVGAITCITSTLRLFRKEKSETVSFLPAYIPINNELAVGCSLNISIK